MPAHWRPPVLVAVDKRAVLSALWLQDFEGILEPLDLLPLPAAGSEPAYLLSSPGMPLFCGGIAPFLSALSYGNLYHFNIIVDG